MILHARSIGDDVHIRHNTTFGVVRRDHNREIPIIEDRVDIACGVCILGAVSVGHDSVIGANAVVLSDVPPHSVAVGIPARGEAAINGSRGRRMSLPASRRSHVFSVLGCAEP